MNKSDFIKELNIINGVGHGVLSVGTTDEEQEFWKLLDERGIVKMRLTGEGIDLVTFNVTQKNQLKKIKEVLEAFESYLNQNQNEISENVYNILYNGNYLVKNYDFAGKDELDFIIADSETRIKNSYDDLEFLDCICPTKTNGSNSVTDNSVNTNFINNSGTINSNITINNIEELKEYIISKNDVLIKYGIDYSDIKGDYSDDDKKSIRELVFKICETIKDAITLAELGAILLNLLNNINIFK